MKMTVHFLPVYIALSVILFMSPYAFSQYDETTTEERDNSLGLEIIEIQNVRYVLPKGTKFRKRAGVITFEGAGEYTARRLWELEQRLQESETQLKRYERIIGGEGKN